MLEFEARHEDGRTCRHRTVRPAIDLVAAELREAGFKIVWLPSDQSRRRASEVRASEVRASEVRAIQIGKVERLLTQIEMAQTLEREQVLRALTLTL